MHYKKMSVWKTLAITVMLCLLIVSVIHSENPWLIDQNRPTPTPSSSGSGSYNASASISPNQPYIGLTWPFGFITQVSLAIVNLVTDQKVVSR